VAMFRHELRWARTIRTVQPLGHAFSFLMYGVPLAFFGAAMIDATVDSDAFALAIVAMPILLRLWMHAAVCRKLDVPSGGASIWLVPVRDVLSFLVWAASFFGRDIDWKGRQFTVRPDGLMTAAKGSDA
jgi:ceramide glucosyltransferase